jgi:hypothetical protein
MDVPTWSLTIDDANAEIILLALESTLRQRDAGPLKDFSADVLLTIRGGGRTIVGDKLELWDIADVVSVFYGLPGASGRVPDEKTAKAAVKWASSVYNRTEKKSDGKRYVPDPKPEPVKAKGKSSVATGARSLFWDEG